MNKITALLAVSATFMLGFEQRAHAEGTDAARSFHVAQETDDYIWNSRGTLWKLDKFDGDFGWAEQFIPLL